MRKQDARKAHSILEDHIEDADTDYAEQELKQLREMIPEPGVEVGIGQASLSVSVDEGENREELVYRLVEKVARALEVEVHDGMKTDRSQAFDKFREESVRQVSNALASLASRVQADKKLFGEDLVEDAFLKKALSQNAREEE
jgi:hypothetical protein